MENFKATADAGLNRLVTSESARARRRRNGDRPPAQHLRRRRRQAAAGSRRGYDDRHACSAIFSTTKAITGTAALQLVEEGKLDLDAPAKNYAPDIGKLKVIEGFDERGEPKLRAPKRDITTRMLLMHTAGLGYDFFNENYNRLAQEKGQPSVITASKKALAHDAAAVRSGRQVGIRQQHRLVRPGDRRRSPANGSARCSRSHL